MHSNVTPIQAIAVRLAEQRDVEAITKLINDAFRIAEGFFIDSDRIDEDAVSRFLASGDFLIAEREGTMLGCVYIEQEQTSPPPRSYLGLLSVSPSHQQAGLGSILMKEAEDLCRNRGSEFMDILVVNLRAELPAFYERRGYVETGKSEFPPDVKTKVPCYFINMAKKL